MTSVAAGLFADDANYPGFIAEGNVNVDPGFTSGDCTDDLVAQMTEHRNSGTFGFWGYDPGNDFTMPNYFLGYPYAEDFSYTASLTSTDGLHVGSLQYYPEEMSDYKGVTVSVDNEDLYIATEFTLSQNYPNPFNPTTTIDYSIVKNNSVSLNIYNILGQKVRTLISPNIKAAGSYSARWEWYE